MSVQKNRLSKSRICGILSIPFDGNDETYAKLTFAADTVSGAVAAISVYASVYEKQTPPEKCLELADYAIKKGAKLLISSFQIKDYPCLIVSNVFEAFFKITSAIRQESDAKIVAITGSIGKTTTSQMILSVMRSRFCTFSHNPDSNANTARLASYGVQSLTPEHEIYVQEVMEGPPMGAPSVISKMLSPAAAVITVIGTAHMEHFGSQTQIFESCLGIQDGIPEDGLLIMNGDDPFQWGAETRVQTVYYGIDNEKADIRAVNIRSAGGKLAFDVVCDGNVVPVTIRCLGKHNVLNALASFAVGKWSGLTEAEIVSGLSAFKTEGIRQNCVHYAGRRFFLDCYNATLESMKSAFETFHMLPCPKGGRRVAILADILECGDNERAYHEQIGKLVTEAGIDKLICYGKGSRYTAGYVLSESCISVFHTECEHELADYVKNYVLKNDLVLVKGSRGMALEHVLDRAFGTWFYEKHEEYELGVKFLSDSNFRYKIYTDHAKAIEKLSYAADVEFPAFVNGKPLMSLGRNLLNGSKYTHSVQLPDTLVNIQYCAFYKANCITEIKLPASLRILDASAFSSCENLTRVEIEEGCTHFGYRAFGNCRNLEYIYIPSTVSQIDKECFINCTKLTIHGKAGTYAEQYASDNKLPFAACHVII